MADVDALGATDAHAGPQRLVHVAEQREPWLRRLAPDGAPRWSAVIAGAGAGSSHARCLRPAPDGTLVAAGGVDGGVDGRDVWVARLSP